MRSSFAWENTATIFLRAKGPVEFVEGRVFNGVFPLIPTPGLGRGNRANTRLPKEGYSVIRALDPQTGARKWDFVLSDFTESGVLTTASDLLFAGGREGYFFALDARSGALLWKASLGASIAAGPMTYSVGGRQYVAISAGNSLFVYALRQ